MQVLIVNASVAIKWFPPFDSEPLAAEARTLLDQWSRAEIQIAVPDLFWAEIGNILWKSVRVGRCSRSEAEELLRTMQMMSLPAIPSAQLVELALSIASLHSRAIYDCLYVALAKQSGAKMVTADEKLVNSLAGQFQIKWLGSFY
jgi:predicted nucleic acid-binding protein